MAGGEILDGFLDLVLGSACVGCGQPGRPLCAACRADLPDTATQSWPTPTPPGLVPPFATGAYDDVLRALVIAHKERGILALGAPLGSLLACSITAAVDAVGADTRTPLLLVPVPSRPSVVRQRGHDATADIARHAARRLDATGRPAYVAPLLRVRPGIADQAGLDAGQRSANLDHALAVRDRELRRHARRGPTHVVLCDDVITTGASLREAQRALEDVGIRVLAAATVAATRRRRRPHPTGAGPDFP
ncbi:hypothetical protein GCM10025786_10600 [Nocardioides caeni]|uniref:ComF family protein n=2 Tax=Nocardioides caeni TaxID=574700 RepID=A0A4S8NRZ1_9ACTN|nr:ComF family protein [Nocardioides caeni]